MYQVARPLGTEDPAKSEIDWNSIVISYLERIRSICHIHLDCIFGIQTPVSLYTQYLNTPAHVRFSAR